MWDSQGTNPSEEVFTADFEEKLIITKREWLASERRTSEKTSLAVPVRAKKEPAQRRVADEKTAGAEIGQRLET